MKMKREKIEIKMRMKRKKPLFNRRYRYDRKIRNPGIGKQKTKDVSYNHRKERQQINSFTACNGMSFREAYKRTNQ